MSEGKLRKKNERKPFGDMTEMCDIPLFFQNEFIDDEATAQ